MRILIITPTIETNSGWGRYSVNIVEEYRKRGISFSICSLDISNTAEENLVQILPFSFLNFFKNLISIRRISSDHDIVHAFDGWPYAVYGFFAVWGTQKRLYVNAVGTYSLPGRSFIKQLLMSRAYNQSSKILCISRYTKDKIDGFYGDGSKSVVVPLGVTGLPSILEEDKARLNAKFQIDGCFPVLITVGAIKKRKGQLDTMKALTLLKNKYPQILYLLVGDDRDVNYVNQILSLARINDMEKNVRVISGSIGDRELSFLYQKSDLAVLNSLNYSGHFEGFGLMFLEAGQFGVPGVGSSECGIEDAIMDGLTGYLTKQGDSEDISEKIKMALEKKVVLGQKAKEFSKEFSWGQTAETYLSFYKADK